MVFQVSNKLCAYLAARSHSTFHYGGKALSVVSKDGQLMLCSTSHKLFYKMGLHYNTQTSESNLLLPTAGHLCLMTRPKTTRLTNGTEA